MAERCIMATRMFVVLAFLLGMTVLALPPAADWRTSKLYPETPNELAEALKPAPQSQAVVPTANAPNSSHSPVRPAHFTRAVNPQLLAEPIERYLPFDRRLREAQSEMALVEARLLDLGATFYRLETTQSARLPYHFVAQFERPGPIPERFHAETSAADPLAAMRQMVEHVESRQTAARP